MPSHPFINERFLTMTKSKFLQVFVFILVFSLLPVLSACSLEKSMLERRQAQFIDVFDTASVLIQYTETEEEFKETAEMIHDELETYHQLYDIYNNYPDLNNVKTINDQAGKNPVSVDQRIIDLLLFSKEAYHKTEGKVNVAFGSVLKLWHDYRELGEADPLQAKIPPMDQLEAANDHCDIEDIVIDESANTVFLKDPDMLLDVGAIAKGYAVERITEYARTIGFTDGLISVGGNIRVLGYKGEDQDLWSIGIQNPDRESEEKDLFVTHLTEESLVTSGDYIRYYTVDGKRYHHIIDPETLLPANYFASVTIITPDSGMGDALSTALFNVSFEEGLSYVESLDNTEAVWVYSDGTIKSSSGFEDLL
jgi:thiamine biosynthesis lipoprotein